MLIPASKSPLLQRWFLWYTQRYLRRSFHAIHLLGEPPSGDLSSGDLASGDLVSDDLASSDSACSGDDGRIPLIVCMNHSSWWDVLVGLYIESSLFGWESYTVMDAAQVQRYRFFNRLGVIGVDRSSLAGAKEFLRYTAELLRGHRRALWITAQGEMVSNSRRPIRFQPGIGHLAGLLPRFALARVALHYEFWDDRLPEAFVSVSPIERVQVCAETFDRRAFVRQQERALEAQLDQMLEHVAARDASAFRPLLRGKGGISPTYDALRRIAARLKGEKFTPDHSQVVTPQWKNRRRSSRT